MDDDDPMPEIVRGDIFVRLGGSNVTRDSKNVTFLSPPVHLERRRSYKARLTQKLPETCEEI